MKYRESDMPSEDIWESFFNPKEVLKKMEVDKNIRNLIDLGFGYETFLLPANEIVRESVIGIDIDENMIEICKEKITDNEASRLHLIHGDISKKDTLKKINF